MYLAGSVDLAALNPTAIIAFVMSLATSVKTSSATILPKTNLES